MTRTVCFGELMLRLSPPGYERLLRAEGVRVDHVLRGGERLGIYFAETGASQRASAVVYDRAQSAISRIEPGTVRWDEVLNGAAWFHCTGITPALVTGRDSAASLRFAVAASALKQTIPGDFNRVLVNEVERLAAGDASGRVQR